MKRIVNKGEKMEYFHGKMCMFFIRLVFQSTNITRQVISMSERYAKNARTLDMYERLREGKSICKAEEAEHFGVDERSIQRDIDDIRAFLAERQQYGDTRQVVFDRRKRDLSWKDRKL